MIEIKERPIVKNTRPISGRCTKENYEIIRKLAKMHKCSVCWLLTSIIEDFVNRVKNNEEIRKAVDN